MKNTRTDTTAYDLVVSTTSSPTPSTIIGTYRLRGGQSATFPGPSSTTLWVHYRLGSSYDYATKATSGSCPASTVTRSWAGDASLASRCVCK